ncbi:SGNH/GDSL hydrolase family protein [Peribacillus butanolivorans]|uniref:hypothetical protein n=1 Tax=Peribacillus butanolivorans TaxID=421767 RepID=UPI0036DC0541
MAFGDSLTYGKGDKDGEGYVEGLEDELNNPDTEKKVRFWNYGIKGDGVIEEDKRMIFIPTNDLF